MKIWLIAKDEVDMAKCKDDNDAIEISVKNELVDMIFKKWIQWS